MSRLLIKNGRIWDGERFFFADVLTEDKVIAKIEKNISDNADFVFDATGKIVSVGLIDTHVHLKGLSSDEFGVEADECSFPYGVTAVCDAGSVYGNKRLLDSLQPKNVVFIGVDIQNNHAYFENTEKYLNKYCENAIGIKVYFDKILSQVIDITPLKEICAYVKSKDLKVMVHCSNSPTKMVEIVETLSSGDILTHAFHGGENTCLDDDFAALNLAKQKGVFIDSGFAGHIHTDFFVLESAIKNGFLPDTISTDITSFSIGKRGGNYGLTMCMNIAKHLGMSEKDIFKSVTSTPAKVLGKQDEWGNLKISNSADFCILEYANEGFNLTDNNEKTIKCNNGYRCVLTICNGQIKYKI